MRGNQMASNVTVSINGTDYPMACAPGEEEKVALLGKRMDEISKSIAQSSGAIGESRLLVMTALIIADRMVELESQQNNKDQTGNDEMAAIIENLALRLEKLASGGL